MTFVYTRRVILRNADEHYRILQQTAAVAFFPSCHCSFCVNLNKVRAIEPWFNNTYIL
ncbi:LytTR family DNA-binding domain-containing protein [Shigella flexneri]